MEQSNFGNSKGFQAQADYIEHVGDRFEMRGPQEILVAGVKDLPPTLGERWVAREGLQAKLRACLVQQPVTELVAAGGFGKSLLVAWAFDALKADYDKRLWVNFRQQRWQQALSFDRFARGMLQEIGFPIKDPRASANDLLNELCYRLGDPNGTQKMLVVLDNFESLRQTEDWPLFQQFLGEWSGQGQRSRVMVTTRPDALTGSVLAIDGLTVEEGRIFLERQALGGEKLDSLVALTAGHPLLLQLAASWVGNTAKGEVDERVIAFFRELFERMPDLAHSLSAETIEAAVALVFEEVFVALPPLLQKGLQQVSVYRIAFDLEMAQAMVPEICAEDLLTLAQQALLVAEEGRFMLHPLIEELVQKRLTKVDQAHKQALSYYQTHYQLWDGTIASCQEALEVFYHNCELGRYDAAYRVIDYYYDVLNKAGLWGDLLPLYQQLADKWRVPEDEFQSQSLVWVWSRLGNLFAGIGKYRKAISAHKRSDKIAEAHHYLVGKAASLGNLGNAYDSLGLYQEAIDYYQQSLVIQREIGDCSGEAALLNNLGLTYYSLDQYQKAIDYYQQSLAIEQEIGGRSSAAAASLNNLGLTYSSLGLYQEAIDYYQKSLVIQQEIGDRSGEAASLNGLGGIYYDFGQYQKAISYYQQSLFIQQEIGNRRDESASLRGLGSVYYCLGQHQRAIDYYQQALAIQQEIGGSRGEAGVLDNLGSTYFSLGQHQKAIDYYQQALAIQQKIGGLRGEATSYWNLNSCYQECGRLKRAMYYRHRAYRLWHEVQLPLAVAPFPSHLKNLYQKMQMEDGWAQTLLESERKTAWIQLLFGYVFFAIRKLLTPFLALHKALKARNTNSKN